MLEELDALDLDNMMHMDEEELDDLTLNEEH